MATPARVLSSPSRPIGLLVVGWYPAADDLFAGRFIADQAQALRATGEVRPDVLSFEPFWLHGDAAIRTTTADAWRRVSRRAMREGRLFVDPAANAPAGIPVGRLGSPAGRTVLEGADNEALHRAASLTNAIDALGPAAERWQLLHAHVGYPDGAAVALASEARHLPFLITEHATYLARLWADPVVRDRYLAGARAARRLIAVSRVLAGQIEAEFEELRGRVLVIPNTVDVEAFGLTGPAERDPDELLWVGYRREVKGMANLLRAFAVVRAARPATRLRLLGRSTTEDEEGTWRRMAAELGIAEAVEFGGPATRAEVAAAMARAAIFVHPSRVETMGVVAVEALASGLPVVATDSGGVTEVLGPDPGAVGALVPKDDPAALGAAIIATLERRMTFGPAALRAAVAGRYSADAVAERLVAVYREVLAESDRERARPGLVARISKAIRSVGSDSARSTGRSAAASLPTRGAAGADGRVVIVAFDRPYLNKLVAAFPGWVFDGAVVVTAGGPSPRLPGAVLTPLDRARQVAAFLSSGVADDPNPTRAAGILGRARAWLSRLPARRRLNRRALPIMQATLDRALDRVGATRPNPALLVCAGGGDVYASRAAVKSGRAIVAPGGLRWLADARWLGSREREAAAATPAADAGSPIETSSAT